MTIKNSVLMLAMATALTGGAYAMTATAAETADTAPMATSDDASEQAADATKEANEDAKEASEDAKEAKEEATDDAGYVPATAVSAQSIYDQLIATGYKDIEDIKYDDGVWNAEAKDPTGQKVEMKLDPNDGHIISTKKD
jgi:basic membrane lipoprotein Med (substrate-binding protein (PBP1-ABC) superfamily)